MDAPQCTGTVPNQGPYQSLVEPFGFHFLDQATGKNGHCKQETEHRAIFPESDREGFF